MLDANELPVTLYARARAATGAWSELVSITLTSDPVPEKNMGRDCNTAGNPISFATGNKYQEETDLRLTGPGLPFGLVRHYNSQSEAVGRFGYGWTDTYSIRLVPDLDRVVLYQADGKAVHFVDDGDVLREGVAVPGFYYSESGPLRTIETLAAGYVLHEPDGIKMYFDDDGRLTQITDLNGNSQVLAYDGGDPARLLSVTDNYGRQILFSYNQDNLVSEAATPVGNFLYTYDGIANLTGKTNPDLTTRSYSYADDPHNLTGLTDENGVLAGSYGYNDQDQAIMSQGAGGQGRVDVSLDSGTSRSVLDAAGQLTTYDLVVKRGVAKVGSSTGPGCGTCGTGGDIDKSYNKRLWAVSSTDAEGTTINYTYDSRGNVLTRTEAAGTAEERTTAYTYHPDYNWVTSISRSSVAGGTEALTVLTYDASGNVLTRTESGTSVDQGAISATTTYIYDALGRPVSIDGPLPGPDDLLQLEYYANEPAEGLNRGQLKKTTNALGHEVNYSAYNAHGLPGTITDANGVAATLAYDGAGRLTGRTVAGQTTAYGYDDTGRLTRVTLPGGRQMWLAYTPAGLLERVTDGLGNYILYQYGSTGLRTGEEYHDSAGLLTRSLSYEYDARGRLSRVIYPDGYDDHLVHSAVGELQSFTDAADRETSYGYDSLHRRTSVLNPDGGNIGYQYDVHDHLSGLTDPLALATGYLYDDLGRLTRTNSPASGLTSYTYDAAGRMTAKADASGRTASYSYDLLGRLTGITYPSGGENVLLIYDQGTNGLGRLTGLTDAAGSASYAYDALGRVVSETRTVLGESYTTGYAYDADGDLSVLTYPSGRTVTYQRDAAGRVAGVQTAAGGPSQTLASNGAYLPFGPVTAMTFGQGVSMTRSYDQRYRLTGRDHQGSNYLIVALSAELPKDFTYDAMDRLLTATGLFGVLGYSYDQAGNRLSETLDGSPDTYSYTSGLLQGVSGRNSLSLGYDGAGRITALGGLNLSYNQDGRLAQVSDSLGVLGQYVYDAYDRRVIKTAGGATTVFHYDRDGRLIAESTDTGTILREYVWLNDEPLALLESGHVYYYTNDHLGSAQVLTNQAGEVVWLGHYSPFGQVTVDPASTVGNNLRFAGQYFDAETGRHYNWHRYYDPLTGRYLTPDPIGLDGGINLFVYAGNNPLRFVDPEGLFNPLKGLSTVGNAVNAGRLFAGGMLKIGAAGGLTSTGIGLPSGAGVAALGAWNLWSAQSALNRSLQQWGEAWNESWSDACWRNLLGVLPFGTEFDDPCEPSVWDVMKDKVENFKDKPGEFIGEIGTWLF